MAPTVWTKQRKWMGNLVPALFWFPPMAIGLGWMVVKGEILGWGLVWLAIGTVIGWFALNFFGLYENGRMRAQLERILKAGGEPLQFEKWFVGFATPRYSSTLDPHEDVGFLLIEPDRLRFVSETRAVEVMRADIREIRFRPNVHSLLFLGRWISVEGLVGQKPIRLMVEPRDERTLLRNRRAGRRLRTKLGEWSKVEQSRSQPGKNA